MSDLFERGAHSDDYEEEQEEEVQSKGKKSKSESKSKSEETKQKKYIRKYTGNGCLPLHEGVIVANHPIFACYSRTNGDASVKLQLFKYIENDNTGNLILYPADTINKSYFVCV